MARSFSAELMDIFRIENSISDLDSQVDERKQNVDKSNDELAALEQRIKEMEERLLRTKGQTNRPSIASVAGTSADANNKTTATNAQAEPAAHLKSEHEDASKARSRPGTAGTARATQQAPSSGNMPPTPGGSEGDYYFVSKDDVQGLTMDNKDGDRE